MSAPIAVIRRTVEEMTAGYPNSAKAMQEVGIIADVYLESERSNSGTWAYEYAGERYKYVMGSRSLFDRWVVENNLRVTT